MDQKVVVYVYPMEYHATTRKRRSFTIYLNLMRTGEYHVKPNKPEERGQISSDLPHLY